MTYSRRCGTSFDDCAYWVCSCAMGAQPPCPPRPMTCERAQEIRARLTAASPTAAESAEFWADDEVSNNHDRSRDE